MNVEQLIARLAQVPNQALPVKKPGEYLDDIYEVSDIEIRDDCVLLLSADYDVI